MSYLHACLAAGYVVLVLAVIALLRGSRDLPRPRRRARW